MQGKQDQSLLQSAFIRGNEISMKLKIRNLKSEIRNQFSLIELLCVVVIAAILIAIVIPAFLNMIKGQSVEVAAREIGSKLKAVRTYAISQRQYTALVFITSQTTTNDDRYCYKAYRPCIVNSSNVIQRWVPDEKWDFLPTGTIIRSLTTSSSAAPDTFTGSEVVSVSSDSDINVFTTASSLYAIIFKPTGEIVGNRVYVTVGQGVYQNGSLLVQNISNRSVITVDQYMGRISYGTQ